jgi:hypothetical protein
VGEGGQGVMPWSLAAFGPVGRLRHPREDGRGRYLPGAYLVGEMYLFGAAAPYLWGSAQKWPP